MLDSDLFTKTSDITPTGCLQSDSTSTSMVLITREQDYTTAAVRQQGTPGPHPLRLPEGMFGDVIIGRSTWFCSILDEVSYALGKEGATRKKSLDGRKSNKGTKGVSVSIVLESNNATHKGVGLVQRQESGLRYVSSELHEQMSNG